MCGKPIQCRCVAFTSYRLVQVRSSAAHRQREDEALLQRMHAAAARMDMVLEGSTSPAVALRKAQILYSKRCKEQMKEYAENLAAWNLARASAADATTDLTSASFTSNLSNLMTKRSPGKDGVSSQKISSTNDKNLQRLSQDESNLSAVAATATPAHSRSSALQAHASAKHIDAVNPNVRSADCANCFLLVFVFLFALPVARGLLLCCALDVLPAFFLIRLPSSDSAWSHNTSSSAASAALASHESSAAHVSLARSPTSEIKSAKRLIKEQPDAIYNCIKRLCKRIESEISSGSPLPA
jgi:hypothetical protein